MTDFGTASLAIPAEEVEKARAIVCCAQYARDNDELRMFLQMLGLVDEVV